MAPETECYALKALKKYKKVLAASKHKTSASVYQAHLPSPSKQRRIDSVAEHSLNLQSPEAVKELGGNPDLPATILYLAYGSNLCAETFQGKRGIRPQSQVNVVVPELVMTFDLAGLPYVEPCFANTKYKKTEPPTPPSESSSLLSDSALEYHKTRWKKGLVGVVYEVTKQDYAHIIATEGGGASYQDVLVQCYELPPNGATVPEHPTFEPFKAHTLYSPVFPPGKKPPQEGGRFQRPDPDYAQPSARYLKLIHDGADEHGLPEEYKRYLHRLRPYTATTQRQKMGRWIFMMAWLPVISLVFSLNKRFADENGKAPPWLVALTSAIFKGMWLSYDGFLYKVFGDGERTIHDDDDDDDDEDDEDESTEMKRRTPTRHYTFDEKSPGMHQAV